MKDNKEFENIFQNLEDNNDQEVNMNEENTTDEVQPIYDSVEEIQPMYEEAVETPVFGGTTEETQPMYEEAVETPVFGGTTEETQPIYEEAVETPVYQDTLPEINDETSLSEEEIKVLAANKPMENPAAKIVLNKEEETIKVEENLSNVKSSLKDNAALKFVIIMGVILLIVIVALPYISGLIG
ncbi:MAG: hypothetical protein PHN42_01235 [Bacilli bacterium]|nr:hypothetical protein [Bacilli bacterium]